MASVSNDPGRCKRILFVDPQGNRPANRLGKMSKEYASSIKVRVEQLLTAKITGVIDRDLSLWVRTPSETLSLR